MWQVARKEDMSPNGFMRLIRQEDGDVIIQCVEDPDQRFASGCVEFCTPMMGGGMSPRTHRALIRLMGAMAQDSLDQQYDHRNIKSINDPAELRRIVEWAKQVRDCERHPLFKEEIESDEKIPDASVE